jgi:type II secretory pathway pseudopilin PulG
MPNGKNGGFVYIGLLIGLVVISIGLTAVSEVWHQSKVREREEDLLYIGNQYRQAITNYYIASPNKVRSFPMQLQDLLQDNRSPDKTRKYLRKLYPDPITGQANWGEVRAAGGQLVGIYSQSELKPIKVAGFALRDKEFADKEQYSQWVFRSALPAANPASAPTNATTGGRVQAATPRAIQAAPR